jgi:hypothetical protein
LGLEVVKAIGDNGKSKLNLDCRRDVEVPKKKDTTSKEIVRFEYSFDPEFNEFYVTGARGGIQNIYHLRLDFYSERVKMKSLNDKIIEHEDGRREIVPAEPWDGAAIVKRTFIVGLNMSFNAAKELAKFLNEKVKDIENVESSLPIEPKEEGDEDNDS